MSAPPAPAAPHATEGAVAPAPSRPRPAAEAGPRDASPAPLPSEQLLQGRKTIEISHNGTLYRLQATKLGKLILTK
ncbi:MAG TPA: hemin uptake protein HemP [Ottowia sp.]|nr:hemin uptake protein HemP [Ottowia sp.]